MKDVYLYPFLKRGGWQTYFKHDVSYPVTPLPTAPAHSSDPCGDKHSKNVRCTKEKGANLPYTAKQFGLAIGSTLTAYFSRKSSNCVHIRVLERDPRSDGSLPTQPSNGTSRKSNSCEPGTNHRIFDASLIRYSYSDELALDLACVCFGNDVALFTAVVTAGDNGSYSSYQVVDKPAGANSSLLFNRVDLDAAGARTVLDRPFTNELEIAHYDAGSTNRRQLYVYQPDETMLLEGLWALTLFEANAYLSTFYEAPLQAEGIQEIPLPLPGISRASAQGRPAVRIFGDFHQRHCHGIYASYYHRKDLVDPPYYPEGHWSALTPILDNSHWFSPEE